MQFITPTLTVRTVSVWSPDGHVRGRRMWELIEPYRYRDDTLGVDLTLTPGFRWDGASVPAFARGYVSPTGPLFGPSAFHDACYGGRLARTDGAAIDKDTADRLFYRAALFCGEDPERARIAYNAVKDFGHLSWNTWHPEDRAPVPEIDRDPDP